MEIEYLLLANYYSNKSNDKYVPYICQICEEPENYLSLKCDHCGVFWQMVPNSSVLVDLVGNVSFCARN